MALNLQQIVDDAQRAGARNPADRKSSIKDALSSEGVGRDDVEQVRNEAAEGFEALNATDPVAADSLAAPETLAEVTTTSAETAGTIDQQADEVRALRDQLVAQVLGGDTDAAADAPGHTVINCRCAMRIEDDVTLQEQFRGPDGSLGEVRPGGVRLRRGPDDPQAVQQAIEEVTPAHHARQVEAWLNAERACKFQSPGGNVGMAREDLPADWRTAATTQHVIRGDGRRGGHMYGAGIPSKTEAPAGWTADQIMDAVADTRMRPMWTLRSGDAVEHLRLVSGVLWVAQYYIDGDGNEHFRAAYPRGGPGVFKNEKDGRRTPQEYREPDPNLYDRHHGND